MSYFCSWSSCGGGGGFIAWATRNSNCLGTCTISNGLHEVAESVQLGESSVTGLTEGKLEELEDWWEGFKEGGEFWLEGSWTEGSETAEVEEEISTEFRIRSTASATELKESWSAVCR